MAKGRKAEKTLKTVQFKTFGCKINQYDTDFLKEAFRNAGFRVLDDDGKDAEDLDADGAASTRVAESDKDLGASPKLSPDLLVVNTCAVTAKSAAKCRQAIRGGVRKGSRVLVTGCYPQVAQEEVRDIPGVLVVTGVLDRKKLVTLANEALGSQHKIVQVTPHSKSEAFEETPVTEPSLTRAYLKIQEGCNDFCTYCIVPYARGPSRSRDIESVLKEARLLIEKGHKEIVLTGTHLGLYGEDLQGSLDLPAIIEEICKIDGLIRLRLSSLEPHDVTDRFVECLRLPQVCHHLHLPLQSGSNRILRKMGRPYTAQDFLKRCEKARKVAPDLGLTTDIIVGFPDETKEDFQDTEEVAREAAFSRLHVFRYSERPKTPAALIPDKISSREKAERERHLINLGKELSWSFYRKHVGRVLEVVVEDERTRSGYLSGVTRNYIRCLFSGQDNLKGRIVSVMARRVTEEGLLSQVLD